MDVLSFFTEPTFAAQGSHKLQVLLCFGFCLYLLTFTACAEERPIDREIQATYNTWNLELKPKFLEVATPEQRIVINKVKFHVIAMKNFNAHSIADANQIVIPVGVTLTVDAISLAYAIVSIHDECFQFLPQFFDAVLTTYRSEDDENPEMYPRLESYCTQLPKVPTDQEVSDRDQKLGYSIVNSMAVIVAHELGHIFYGDYSPGKQTTLAERRAIEMRADDFAFNLASKAHYIPYMTFGNVFPVITALEDPDEAAGGGNHPSTYCRELKLIDKMKADPVTHTMLTSMTIDQRRSMEDAISKTYITAKQLLPANAP